MEAEEQPGPGKNCFRAVPVRPDDFPYVYVGLDLYCLNIY